MKKKSILVVEDNPFGEILTLRILKQHGVFTEIVAVRDGEEALERLLPAEDNANRVQEELPALILLDLNLPRMHGLEVLRRLRAHPKTKSLPIVIFTSSMEESDVITAYQLGANSYINKPVDFDEFSKTIRQVSQYWGEFNTLPAARGPYLPNL